MLSKILIQFVAGFGRSLKTKKPSFTKSQADSINLSNIKGFNKQLKQKEQQLKDKIQRLVNSNLTEQQILNQCIDPVKAESMSGPNQSSMVNAIKQEMIINEIMQNFKNKKELPISSNYEDQTLSSDQKEHKKQMILSKLGQIDSGQINYGSEEISFQERLRMKYPSSIIKEAQERKNMEMAYFRENMASNFNKQHTQPYSQSIFQRRLKKNESYKDILQKDKFELELLKQRKKKRNEQIKQLNKLKLKHNQEMRKQQIEIVPFENEEYYREKGIQQFEARELNKNPNEQLLEAGKQDMEQASNLHMIMIQEIEDEKYSTDWKKSLYDQSSFGQLDKQMEKLQKSMVDSGISLELEEISMFKKEILFNEKKQREDQRQYQKYLLKKERKTKMKELIKQIHKQKLREDLDYNKEFKSRFDDGNYDPLDVEGNLQKLKELKLQRDAVFVSTDVKSDVHFKKTEVNMTNFVMSCIYSGLLNPNDNIYTKIKITGLIFNKKKTVINIFWKFEEQKVEDFQKQKNIMTKRLSKHGPFVGGKMAQLLGLRYAPDIRFHFDKILPQTEDIVRTLSKAKDQVIQYELKNLMSKGHIKTEQEFNQAKEKLQVVSDESLRNYHNRPKLLLKQFQRGVKKHKSQSKLKPAELRFWQHIDKL